MQGVVLFVRVSIFVLGIDWAYNCPTGNMFLYVTYCNFCGIYITTIIVYSRQKYGNAPPKKQVIFAADHDILASCSP